MQVFRETSELLQELKEQKELILLNEEKYRKINEEITIAEKKIAFLHSIIDSSDDGIISKDLDGIITGWNTAATQIFGYSAEEMIGASILKLIPPDRHDEEPEILKQLRSGNKIDHFQTIRKTKAGEMIDVSVTISPIRNSEGQIVGISKILRDIRLEKAADVLSRKLSAIVSSSDDAIISKDLNSTITSWNKGAHNIFGYTEDEMLGQSIIRLIPDDRLDEETDILAKLRMGLHVDHFETLRKRKDGTLIDVSLTISPIKDASGKVIGVSKIARNITERKLLDKRKEDFSSFVSHELKTPLTTMRSYVQLAQRKVSGIQDSGLTDVLTRAANQTIKMERIIETFLKMSRLEDGKLTLNLQPFDIAAAIQRDIDELAASAQHPISYAGDSSIVINADEEILMLVIGNLISNAQKYSPGNQPIVVSCKADEMGKVTISVADHGIGISISDQEKLFKKFSRIGSEQTAQISGFGIGLYLASLIVGLHGSTIQVRSTPGQGSSFYFTLNADLEN